MDEHDFVLNEVAELIEKVKAQNPEAGRYLEDSITLTEGGLMVSADAERAKRLLGKVVIRDGTT